jgi:hypothetical protein
VTAGDARTAELASRRPGGLIALQTECTIDLFVNTVFNYPSLGEAYKYAAYDGLGAFQRRAAAGTQG